MFLQRAEGCLYSLLLPHQQVLLDLRQHSAQLLLDERCLDLLSCLTDMDMSGILMA